MQTTNDTEKEHQLKALAAIGTAGFFWALIEHFGMMLPTGYSPLQTVWSRYLVHLIFMLIVFSPRRGYKLIRTRRLGMQITRSLMMLGMPACFIVGVALLPIEVVWVISWCSVVIELALSALFLKERVCAGLWVAAICGWLGVWVMSGVHLPPLNLSYLAPVGMGSCFAIYVVMTRCMGDESTSTKVFHTALWVFIVLSGLMLFLWKTPSIQMVFLYTCIGISGVLLLFFLDKAIEMAPVSLTASVIYSVPIWSFLQDCFIKGKIPGPMSVAGALIILVSFVLIVGCVLSGRVSM